MSSVELITGFLCLLFLLFLIVAALGKSEWQIAEEIKIQRPSQDVWDYIRYLKNSEQYNKWVMTDPGMQKKYTGTDGSIGFIYSWDSKQKSVGKGDQEIIHLLEGSKIDYQIRFKKPFDATSYSALILTRISDKQTNVCWTFKSRNNFMMKVLHLAFNLKKVLKNDLQSSLQNLKAILEQ